MTETAVTEVVLRSRPMPWPTGPEMGAIDIPRDRFLARDSFWYRRLPANAQLSPDSNAFRGGLLEQLHMDSNGNRLPDAVAGNAWIGELPGLYVVPPDYPLTPVSVNDQIGLQAPTFGLSTPELHAQLQEGVPIPAEFVTSRSPDAYVNVYSPSLDILWELYNAARDDVHGFHVGYAGIMRDCSQSPGYYRDRYDLFGNVRESHMWGPGAASISLLGGVMEPAEVLAGSVTHAIMLNMGWSGMPPVFPAQRGDGVWGMNYPPEGSRIRFPADTTIESVRARFNPGHWASLTDHQRTNVLKFLDYVVTAGRDYGIMVCDQTGGGPSLILRDFSTPTQWAKHWLDVIQPYDVVNPSEFMWALPWHRAEFVHPDFNR